MNKLAARNRRRIKTRSHIKRLAVNRLTIHRTSQHIYAQVISADGNSTLASASTTQADVKSS
jgi:large subunit ribosomal protein L18